MRCSGECADTQAPYPVQRRGSYLKKLLISLGLVTVYATAALRFARAILHVARLPTSTPWSTARSARFLPREPERAFLRRLRQRPCRPLLAMLSSRLRTFDQVRLARRSSAGERFAHKLADGRRASWWAFIAEDALALSRGRRRSRALIWNLRTTRPGREPGNQQHRRRRCARRAFAARTCIAG